MDRNAFPALIKTLSDELYERFSDKLGISRKKIREMFDTDEFKHALSKQKNDTLCRDLLSVCRPFFDCEAKRTDDLLFEIYEAVIDSMFLRQTGVQTAPVKLFGPYLTVLGRCIEFEKSRRSEPDILTDIDLATAEEQARSRVKSEYSALRRTLSGQHFIELLRMGRELGPFDALSHTAGVHNVALHIARGAYLKNIPVDVALASAASVCHDIGKFGCRGKDAARIPYVHYYYTDLWLRSNEMPEIAHIAANHSTWDLELENLPIESLILIYADFRVRSEGTQIKDRENIRIRTLDEAYELILSKLFNVDEEKKIRYKKVFLKLRDFEEYLIAKGVDTLGSGPARVPMFKENVSVASPREAVREMRMAAVENNILLMHSISHDISFSMLLESARNEKNLYRIRTYLHLFNEYFTYMTKANKLRLLSFLYELLMHHESDIRRIAAQLMGKVLANSGVRYRKELPEHAPGSAIAPALNEMLSESASLWQEYLNLLIEPDRKISPKHRLRIMNSLKVVLKSLLENCSREDARLYLDPFLTLFFRPEALYDRFVLTDSLSNIPFSYFSKEECSGLIRFCTEMLKDGELKEKVCALRLMTAFREEFGPQFDSELLHSIKDLNDDQDSVISARDRLLARIAAGSPSMDTVLESDKISELFLENLKAAVHWIIKINNIDRLMNFVEKNAAERFHVAAHLANLLLVSEHLPVRIYASEALTAIAPSLAVAPCNEIVVDLVRSLKTGQYEFIKYVSPCLGKLLMLLPQKELIESIGELESMIRSSNTRAACAALQTLSAYITRSGSAQIDGQSFLSAGVIRAAGLLLAGLAHYDETVRHETLNLIGNDLFASDILQQELKARLFALIHKKLLVLLYEQPESRLTLFNTAAMMNRIYRYVTCREAMCLPFEFKEQGAAAFFPGTFDPFSTGHRLIVEKILSLGIEVYLAVDEFSWSKKTQPTLVRRQIVNMSTADLFGVYLFPGDTPVNLSNPSDLIRLSGLFPERQLYIVAGSDVIENASAYRDPSLPGSVCGCDHIVFMRISEGGAQESDPAKRLKGKVIRLSLPPFYEDVSSTRIRENIDKNLDISMMVDPMAQEYIYANSLYVRAPQYKTALDPAAPEMLSASRFNAGNSIPPAVLSAFGERFYPKRDYKAVWSGSPGAPGFMFALSHTVNTAGLYEELTDIEAAQAVRHKTSGKIIVIDKIHAAGEEEKEMLVNEILASSLIDDHTYALYSCDGSRDPMMSILERKGFSALSSAFSTLLIADMRSPMVLIEDALQNIKEPLDSDPSVIQTVKKCRIKLQNALTGLFPGRLLLSFDSTGLNRALIKKVMEYNGVAELPAGSKDIGKFMCVPYGKILTGSVVPHTVTKSLHVEKVFNRDISDFEFTEYPGYAPITAQINTIGSFGRPVILVDDLLHKGSRLKKLETMLSSSEVAVQKIIVGILSGKGKDLMERKRPGVDCVYFIPNLSYWFTESLQYPFIGGDSVQGEGGLPGYLLPSVNLILPYKMPDFITGTAPGSLFNLSLCSLENACDILRALEKRHQAIFGRSLTLGRLKEALHRPRIPDKGSALKYDPDVLPSAVIQDDIGLLKRIGERDK